MKLGIVGLPNVGKSTLFNAITQAGAESANYPFCTIDPNVGMVAVPDERLQPLTDLYHAKKDHPGGRRVCRHRGSGHAARARARVWATSSCPTSAKCDAIVHVVRCFDRSENIVHVDAARSIRQRDIETINLELIACGHRSDLRSAAWSARVKAAQERTKSVLLDVDALGEKLQGASGGGQDRPHLFEGFGEDEDVDRVVNESDLLSDEEGHLRRPTWTRKADTGNDKDRISGLNGCHRRSRTREGAMVLPICAKLEEDIARHGRRGEGDVPCPSWDLHESGLDRLIARLLRSARSDELS